MSTITEAPEWLALIARWRDEEATRGIAGTPAAELAQEVVGLADEEQIEHSVASAWRGLLEPRQQPVGQRQDVLGADLLARLGELANGGRSDLEARSRSAARSEAVAAGAWPAVPFRNQVLASGHVAKCDVVVGWPSTTSQGVRLPLADSPQTIGAWLSRRQWWGGRLPARCSVELRLSVLVGRIERLRVAVRDFRPRDQPLGELGR